VWVRGLKTGGQGHLRSLRYKYGHRKKAPLSAGITPPFFFGKKRQKKKNNKLGDELSQKITEELGGEPRAIWGKNSEIIVCEGMIVHQVLTRNWGKGDQIRGRTQTVVNSLEASKISHLEMCFPVVKGKRGTSEDNVVEKASPHKSWRRLTNQRPESGRGTPIENKHLEKEKRVKPMHEGNETKKRQVWVGVDVSRKYFSRAAKGRGTQSELQKTDLTPRDEANSEQKINIRIEVRKK